MSRSAGALSVSAALLLAGAANAEPDWAPGEKLTYVNCGRCHVVGERNRMGGIGSTPGFAVIRTWPDWEAKMTGFYLLNPHPAFTQVAGVTAPFPAQRPSPIYPISLTPAQIDAIVEYARSLAPADLGPPIR